MCYHSGPEWIWEQWQEVVLQLRQSSSITGPSPSDISVSYPVHSLEKSCPSAEIQSVYSTAQMTGPRLSGYGLTLKGGSWYTELILAIFWGSLINVKEFIHVMAQIKNNGDSIIRIWCVHGGGVYRKRLCLFKAEVFQLLLLLFLWSKRWRAILESEMLFSPDTLRMLLADFATMASSTAAKSTVFWPARIFFIIKVLAFQAKFLEPSG